jgi:hypothetical protein
MSIVSAISATAVPRIPVIGVSPAAVPRIPVVRGMPSPADTPAPAGAMPAPVTVWIIPRTVVSVVWISPAVAIAIVIAHVYFYCIAGVVEHCELTFVGVAIGKYVCILAGYNGIDSAFDSEGRRAGHVHFIGVEIDFFLIYRLLCLGFKVGSWFVDCTSFNFVFGAVIDVVGT